jgi:hypothetical protein
MAFRLRKNLLSLSTAIAASFCFLAGAAHGADSRHHPSAQYAESSKPKPWTIQVTPYIWAANFDARISPFRRSPKIAVEKSFSDVVDDLNFGGFLNVWGRYDRFVFSGDIVYVNTTDSGSKGPLPAMTIPGIGMIPAGGNIKAKVDSKQFTSTIMGGYRVIDIPQFTLDALGGARLWSISNDATVTGQIGGISQSITHGERFHWVDPLIGARAFLSLNERLSFQGQVDVGGFDIGSDSTWSALGTVNYVFKDRWSLSAGYKLIDVDYNDDGHAYDARLSGPVLGATYRF